MRAVHTVQSLTEGTYPLINNTLHKIIKYL